MADPATLFRARRRRRYHRRLRAFRIALPPWQVTALRAWARELDPSWGERDWAELVRVGVELLLSEHRLDASIKLAVATELALAGELEIGGASCS